VDEYHIRILYEAAPFELANGGVTVIPASELKPGK